MVQKRDAEDPSPQSRIGITCSRRSIRMVRRMKTHTNEIIEAQPRDARGQKASLVSPERRGKESESNE
jgi:hypothetical protein